MTFLSASASEPKTPWNYITKAHGGFSHLDYPPVNNTTVQYQSGIHHLTIPLCSISKVQCKATSSDEYLNPRLNLQLINLRFILGFGLVGQLRKYCFISHKSNLNRGWIIYPKSTLQQLRRSLVIHKILRLSLISQIVWKSKTIFVNFNLLIKIFWK